MYTECWMDLSHWNTDHTQYTDELGHTYPRTGETWSDDDRCAYHHVAYVRMVREYGRDTVRHLKFKAEVLGLATRRDFGFFDSKADRIYDLAHELDEALNNKRYADAADFYEEAIPELTDDWGFLGGWGQTNGEGKYTLTSREKDGLRSRVPAISEDDGTVYALRDED